ncbi:MAG TPA: trehalose-6-phosphate synthase [Terriglobales bacterium]|nr:trehalose-6-phosphate synthase [Terriglobales bacterium]
MRVSLRLFVPLLLAVIAVSLLFAGYQVRRDRKIQERDLSRRAELLADSLEESVTPVLGSPQELRRLVERFGNRERLAGIAVYNNRGHVIAVSSGLDKRLAGPPAAVLRAIQKGSGTGEFVSLGDNPVYIFATPLTRDQEVVGSLAIVQDAAYIARHGTHLWRYLLFGIGVQVVLILFASFLIVRRSILAPLARTAQWTRALRIGTATAPAETDLFNPLTREVATFAASLAAARASAEKEAQLRVAGDSSWTAERLSVCLRTKLAGSRLFVVANREPYMHVRRGKGIETIVPASGLVTALEPILCACDGTWVAHGSGDADREMVDERSCVRVPPEQPRYTLRRVWLTKEEEEGYYFGFSNEGLWPLCHIAHTRPLFRESDWGWYRQVSAKFAEAVLDEMAGTEQPLVIVQDYHFALLPRLLKRQRPDARVAIFWHIPWPNPEAFRICPWQRELLDGLLGADLIGFHIQAHCNNFLETVDRALESRIDREHFAVNRHDHLTSVRPFPISVVWEEPAPGKSPKPVHKQQSALMNEMGVEALFLGVGVDRVDYTKGLPERFLAIERFLEKYPAYQGKLTFAQIGAPSRTHIKRYHDLLAEVEAEADRINWRFQSGKWKPIVFLKGHHSHEQIERFYRAADFCMVTSLHDGMNLVAKEFVAARDDEQGVLLLSAFTGAARELHDALIVNPYDTEHLADAIFRALEMEPREKKVRMQHMRRVVKENNVYRWAASLIGDLCETRIDVQEGGRDEHRALAAR